MIRKLCYVIFSIPFLLPNLLGMEIPTAPPTKTITGYYQFLTDTEREAIFAASEAIRSLRSIAFAEQPGQQGKPTWQAMTNEQRLAHLESIALKSAGGLRIATKTGLIWLQPIVGEEYVDGLAEEMALVPESMIAAAPGHLETAKRQFDKLGMDGDGLDNVVNKAGTILFQSLDKLSDPSFIGEAMKPIDE